ncbi:MAG: helicase-associated domain-containing protein [Myxococcota bacterium]
MAEDSARATEGNRRRRRRRRRRRPIKEGESGKSTAKAASPRSRARAGTKSGESSPNVRLPETGHLPHRRPPFHPSKHEVANASARRRRLTRTEVEELAAYLERLPDQMVEQLYKGMGGQPSRISGKDRMIQLAVRAIAQGSRLGSLIRGLHQRDRQALAILVQAGGVAHHNEFHQELTISLGGNEREWVKVMTSLGDKGLIASSERRGDDFFYIIPEPLIGHLVEHLMEDLALPSFDHEDVRVANAVAFSPPLEFSVVTLATYIDQHPPRLTQRQEIFKVHKDEMDNFFSQIWQPDSDLFSFHIEFLMVHGMVELRGDRLQPNPAVLEEWLQLENQDQRDLVFSALEKRFPDAEWVLWVIHDMGGEWVPERPLQALYRRWRRGAEWRKRLHSDDWKLTRQAQRESFTFAPLVTTGLVELGQWGQEKFYRLSSRGKRLIAPPEEEGFSQFYLTPSFEIMAPAGMAPMLFFRIGEIAELQSCDRANKYKITEISIERAMERGWRRDEILEFLRENSQIGLPDNVEQTLRGWMGHHGDVEFHDVMLLTVHRSQIRKIESHRKLKPLLLHRFVPGMYAVDRSRMAELNAALSEADFAPVPKVREYPGDPGATDARKRLMSTVNEAREDREELLSMAHSADTQPEKLTPLGNTRTRGRRRKREELPPRVDAEQVRDLCERAIALGQDLKMLYVTRGDQRRLLKVTPERLAVTPKGKQVLVARDHKRDERLSYQLVQIERLAPIARR